MSTRGRRAAFLQIAGALVAVLHAPPARAAGSSVDSTKADALFNQAVKLFESGRVREACPLFAQSMQLDPANGTLQDLALCHEREGRTATALREFKELAKRAARDGQPERERLGNEKAAALSTNLSRLSLSMPTDANVAEIRIDDASLPQADWSRPIPLDPGDHAVRLTAPGKKTVSLHVTIAASPSTQVVVVTRLEDDSPTRASGDVAEQEPSEGWSTQRKIALGVGAAGVVSAAIGGVFGFVALSKWSQAKSDCNPQCTEGSQATNEANSERSSAESAATASTVSFLIGGAALVAAVVLYLTDPHSASPAATMAPGATGAVFNASF